MFRHGCGTSGKQVIRIRLPMYSEKSTSTRIFTRGGLHCRIQKHMMFYSMMFQNNERCSTSPSALCFSIALTAYEWVAMQDEFVATMHTIVTKRQSFKVTKEEGWYSEGEMKTDLKWSQSGPYPRNMKPHF